MLTSVLQGIVLGIVQGATEFFPVSSTGHLILFPRFFGWQDPGPSFDVIVHFGTLAALLWMYRVQLIQLYRDAVTRKSRPARIFVGQILLACIPALLIGGIGGNWIEDHFRGSGFIAFQLAFWGIILWIVDRRAASRAALKIPRVDQVGWRRSFWIGISQAIALFPGVSRSGITMTTGLANGLDRETAVQFSFFVSIPTIAAAGAFGVLTILRHGMGSLSSSMLTAGLIASFISGLFAIKFLQSYVARRPFTVFVVYRLVLAAAIMVLL